MKRSSGNLAYVDAEYMSHVGEVDIRVAPVVVVAQPRRVVYPIVKRFFDVVLSVLALVLLSPVFLVTAIAIKAEDGGPVYYRHNRIGKNGKEIWIYKFRTMQVNADRLEDVLSPKQLEEYYREFKLHHDPRITKIGNFLRNTSIDELPQLVNVLCGQMSIIGPRPLVKHEFEEKYSAAQQRILLSVRPGLTGMWQVSGRSECTYESGKRQNLELHYVQSVSLGTDIGILFKTVKVVLRRIGAC